MPETYLDREELAYNSPLARSPRLGMVRLASGDLRRVRLGVPDTFFTIPARARIKGRTVHGFVFAVDGDYRFQALGTNRSLSDWHGCPQSPL
jgi:hypothetical protein